MESYASDMKFEVVSRVLTNHRLKLQAVYNCKIPKTLNFESAHSMCQLNLSFEISVIQDEQLILNGGIPKIAFLICALVKSYYGISSVLRIKL